jgi:hypothetical protein
VDGLVRFLRNVFGSFVGDVKGKYESRHRAVSALAARAGLRLYNRHLLWQSDEAFLRAWAGFPEATPVVPDRRFVLFSSATSVRTVPGDTAECGSYRGGGSYLILASQSGVEGKTHHVFDSFEGLSEPGSRDDTQGHPTAFAWQKNQLAVDEAVVNRNLGRFGNYRLYRGWIPARFGEVEGRRFSFVHIDVDLYQPTLDSLSFFYPRMNSGGIILCDDYGLTTCPGAKGAFDDFLRDKPETVIHLTTGQGILIKR